MNTNSWYFRLWPSLVCSEMDCLAIVTTSVPRIYLDLGLGLGLGVAFYVSVCGLSSVRQSLCGAPPSKLSQGMPAVLVQVPPPPLAIRYHVWRSCDDWKEMTSESRQRTIISKALFPCRKIPLCHLHSIIKFTDPKTKRSGKSYALSLTIN